LGLQTQTIRPTTLSAKRIIKLAKAGERNPDILCEKALKGLRSRRTSKQFQSSTRAEAAMSREIQDVNDGKPWSEMDLFDLRNSLAYGRSIEEVADFLCRSSSLARG
jgi:hypothetical protein